MESLKIYWVVADGEYYPSAGLESVRGTFEFEEDAIDFAKSLEEEYDWVDVIDISSRLKDQMIIKWTQLSGRASRYVTFRKTLFQAQKVPYKWDLNVAGSNPAVHIGRCILGNEPEVVTCN